MSRYSILGRDGLERLAVDAASWLGLLGNGMVRNEFFVPKLGLSLEPYLERGDRTGAHHLLRYQWAVRTVGDLLPARDENSPSQMILDIACGAGYGSYMLAREHPRLQVVGADYDPAAIRHAQQNYTLPNLRFQRGDLLQWDETIGDMSYDFIISFDTMEHCKHREIMFENLIKHISLDGALLLCVPCGHSENLLRPRWIHHAIEYRPATLYDFLRRYFADIARPDGENFPHREVFDQLDGTGISYMLQLNPVLCRSPIAVDNPYKS